MTDPCERIATDGPFMETKEVLAGFSVWKAKDMYEAVEWVMKGPDPMFSPSEVLLDLRKRFLLLKLLLIEPRVETV